MTVFQENRELLNAFRSGDGHSLRKVYYFYIKNVEQFIATGWFDPKTRSRAGRINDFDRQAELIQEIFLRAFSENARLSYDGIRPYKAFLLCIARNVIIDYLRKRPRDAISHVCVDLDDKDITLDQVPDGESIRVEAESTEEEMDWQRYIQATAEYVATLDEMRQQFVELRFQQELSLLEVARCLGVTRGKARFLEKDLGRRLKRHLQALNMSKCSNQKDSVTKTKRNFVINS